MSDGDSDQKQSVKRRFDSVADTYSTVGPDYFPHFGRRLVEFARIPSGARVLDVACGRGATLFPLAEKVGRSGVVTGIDLSPGMVAATGRDIAARGISNAIVAQMDAESLRFADGQFTVVLCAFALFFFPNLRCALAEFRRVLGHGGQVVASTWSSNRDERWRWLLPLVDSYLPPESSESPGVQPEPDFETLDGLAAILSGAGFGSLCLESATHTFFYRDEANWWDTGWANGQFRDIEAAAGAEGVQRFKAEAFERIQAFKQPGGVPQRVEALFASGIKA